MAEPQCCETTLRQGFKYQSVHMIRYWLRGLHVKPSVYQNLAEHMGPRSVIQLLRLNVCVGHIRSQMMVSDLVCLYSFTAINNLQDFRLPCSLRACTFPCTVNYG